MVLCILALPIFAVLAIFSVKYRKLTLDALDCLFRTVTLRKCESRLDERIRSDLTGKVLRLSPTTAKFFYKNYKIVSWIVLILMVWSIYTASVGIYNYATYGNCNGPASNDFCVFDPTGANSKIAEAGIDISTDIVLPVVEDNDPIIGNPNAELTIIEFGCYACQYTHKAEPIVQEVLDYYGGKVNLQFKTFYIPSHALSHRTALVSDCMIEQGRYQEFHKAVFSITDDLTDETLDNIILNMALNQSQFNLCMANQTYKSEADADTLMGIHAGVQGTPTFFINQQKIVGPKPFKTFKKVIDEELAKVSS